MIEKGHIAARLRQLASEIEFGKDESEIEILLFHEQKVTDAYVVISEDGERSHYLAAVDVDLRFVFPNTVDVESKDND